MEYEISPTQTTGPDASTFSSGPRAVAAANTSRARPTRIPSGAPDGILVGLALLVFAAATARGPLEKVLASGPVVWVGEISYSIYMVHFPVLIISRRILEA